MKKLIQICAFLSLVFAFTVVSAQAQQTVRQYEAKIPFDFNVGQKSYQAGNYVIKISRLASNGLILSLEDENNNKLQSVIVSETDNLSQKAPKLMFDMQENQRYLTKIYTSEVGVSLAVPKSEKHNSARKQQQPKRSPNTEVVSATAHKK